MTSLLDATSYPASAFSALFHGRWRTEEAYKRITHRLHLEHTSGLTWLAAQQDIGAKIVWDNLNALAAFLATEEHIPVESKHRINRTLAFNNIRRLLRRALALRIVGYNTFAEALAEIAKKSPNLRQTFVKK